MEPRHPTPQWLTTACWSALKPDGICCVVSVPGSPLIWTCQECLYGETVTVYRGFQAASPARWSNWPWWYNRKVCLWWTALCSDMAVYSHYLHRNPLGFKRSRPWPPVAPLQGYLASPTWALNTAGLCRRQVLHINTQAEYLNGKSSSKKKLQLCDLFLPSIFKCYFYLDLLL